MSSEAVAPLTPDAVEALLAFLPLFEAPDFEPGAVQGGCVVPSPSVRDFVQTLYAHDVLVRFDWPSWRPAPDVIREPEAIAGADEETLRRALTVHVRADRFSEGHLVEAFRRGLIQAVLRRFEALRRR